MTAETLSLLLAYMLLLSTVHAAIYKRCRDCEELLMVVFLTFIIISLIVILALMIGLPLIAALGAASLIGLAAYYAADDPPNRSPLNKT
jgi:ABC-type branched-subunit amino acid transport system permease subunit